MTTRGCTFSREQQRWRRCAGRRAAGRARTPASCSRPRPVVVVGLLVDRPAVGLREDEVLVLPPEPASMPLAELGGSVRVQHVDERQGERERALAALGLWAPRRHRPCRGRGGCCGRTVRVPATRSMSFHCSASASDCRRPRPGRPSSGPSCGGACAASRTARASSGVRAVAGCWAAAERRVDEGGDVARDVAALHGDVRGRGTGSGVRGARWRGSSRRRAGRGRAGRGAPAAAGRAGRARSPGTMCSRTGS